MLCIRIILSNSNIITDKGIQTEYMRNIIHIIIYLFIIYL